MGTRTYVRIRQDVTPEPETLHAALEAVDAGISGIEIIEAAERPVAYWGTGVFVPDENGELYRVASNYDTSD
jgi:hypothetical protein